MAEEFCRLMDQSLIWDTLCRANIFYGDTILHNLEEIYRKFVLPGIEQGSGMSHIPSKGHS